MTSGQHMLWMLDEYEQIHGGHYPGVITGKPVGMGGSLGRTEATGYGVVFTVREALKELGVRPAGHDAAVQGFGNVAQYAIELYNQIGGTVVASPAGTRKTSSPTRSARRTASTSPSCARSPTASAASTRPRRPELGYEVLPGDAWIEQDVDILFPCALRTPSPATTSAISKRVKLIAEGANGPTTPEADHVLHERGIFVIPDFLANAGGVTCSYLEQVQSNMNYFWEKDEVLGKLDVMMTSPSSPSATWPASASSTCATRPTRSRSPASPRPARTAAG
jgi:glutamate dehydrogenase